MLGTQRFRNLLVCLFALWSARVMAAEPVEPQHRFEWTVGLTPVSYGLHAALGGDGHFDDLPSAAAVGLDLNLDYLLAPWLGIGVGTDYVLSFGRSEYWEREFSPLMHRFRAGPRVQFRMRGQDVTPYLLLAGGFSMLASRNYDDPYTALGWFGALGFGANIDLSDPLALYLAYALTLDWTHLVSYDGADALYLDDVPVLSFLHEASVGLLFRF